jgi:cell division GTPase FtsZ
MDGSDAAISHDAISLGKRAKAQGLLTIAVVLGANSDVRPDADQFSDGFLEALAAGTHVSVRLETPKNQMDCDRTAIVLQSLTSGLANLCNLQASINVDYEDVLTVLGNPARLSVGVGTAIGGERALVAAQAALADVRPAVRNPELVQGVLIMISARQYQLRLSECRIAMNTIRAAFGPDAHCIYGVYCSELPAGKTAGEMNDRIEITIFVTSPMQEVAQH